MPSDRCSSHKSALTASSSCWICPRRSVRTLSCATLRSPITLLTAMVPLTRRLAVWPRLWTRCCGPCGHALRLCPRLATRWISLSLAIMVWHGVVKCVWSIAKATSRRSGSNASMAIVQPLSTLPSLSMPTLSSTRCRASTTYARGRKVSYPSICTTATTRTWATLLCFPTWGGASAITLRWLAAPMDGTQQWATCSLASVQSVPTSRWVM